MWAQNVQNMGKDNGKIKIKILHSIVYIPKEGLLYLGFSGNDQSFTSQYHLQKKHPYLHENWLRHHQK